MTTLQCISSQKQGTKLWYVLEGGKWMLLPKNTCRMLTDAKNSNKQEVFDALYVYDLISDERKHKGKEELKERIIFIEGKFINFHS